MDTINGTRAGTWHEPPCYFCKRPIEATHDHAQAPMYIRAARAWSCRECWEHHKSLKAGVAA
jgi:Zn-finger protein